MQGLEPVTFTSTRRDLIRLFTAGPSIRIAVSVCVKIHVFSIIHPGIVPHSHCVIRTPLDPVLYSCPGALKCACYSITDLSDLFFSSVRSHKIKKSKILCHIYLTDPFKTGEGGRPSKAVALEAVSCVDEASHGLTDMPSH